MRIDEALARGNPVFSFEFFPPENDAATEALFATVASLRQFRPAFISVTYGAGGSSRTRTVELVKRIATNLDLTVLAHVTCMGSTADELRTLFHDLESSGIENVLALRGDPPKEGSGIVEGGFRSAKDLVAMLNDEFSFCIGAACYPEVHLEATDASSDLAYLALKVRSGAKFLITQIVFDNDAYFDFVGRARDAGITVPIIPGIMPITNYKQVARFTAKCGTTIPEPLRDELERHADDPNAVADLGVAYASLQCAQLLARGAPGIHFYTLNKSPSTRAVVSALLASGRWPALAEVGS